MKTIHIFDMDDTLFKAPTFSEFVGDEDDIIIDDKKYFPNYFKKIKTAFLDILNKQIYFKKSGDFILPINYENNKQFNDEYIEYFKEKKYDNFLDSHDGIIVVKPFENFHSSPETLSKILNLDIIKKYINSKNKMIVTGRDENLRNEIIKIFKEINLELPNYGLILYQGGESIKIYKTKIILTTIELNNWDEVNFYEDRPDWLYHAEGAVKEKFPKVKFVPHLITNVKENLKI